LGSQSDLLMLPWIYLLPLGSPLCPLLIVVSKPSR
jgi:hypothetical protein